MATPNKKALHIGVKRLWGLSWSLQETLKTSFNVPGDDQGSHHDDLSVSGSDIAVPPLSTRESLILEDDVTRTPWRLNITGHSIDCSIACLGKQGRNVKALHYWPFVRGIHRLSCSGFLSQWASMLHIMMPSCTIRFEHKPAYRISNLLGDEFPL